MKKLLIIGLIWVFLIPDINAQNTTSKATQAEDGTEFIEINGATQYNDMIKSGGLVLVDFYATWCGPCRMMTPVFKQLKKESTKKITIVKVDVDKNGEIARNYKISAIPAIYLFKDGRFVWNHTGAIGLEDLKAVIDKY